MKVSLSDIVLEQSVYPRVVDKKGLPYWIFAHKYYLAMKGGSVFPPIALARIKGKLILVDGWNRCIATKKLGAKEIEAEILATCKPYDDVYITALRLNTVHGTSLSPYEVALAIKKLRKKGVSYNQIAEIVHASKEVVQKMQKERTSGNMTVKHMVIPVKSHVTDSNQRILAAGSQVTLLHQLIVILKEDLLDLENKDVRKAIEEVRELINKLTMMVA